MNWRRQRVCMSEPATSPDPYRDSYSEIVRAELRLLVARARELGRAAEVLTAVREFDRRLRLYPQFGEPLREYEIVPAKLWIGVVPPVVAKYLVDEGRRLVIVVAPF